MDCEKHEVMVAAEELQSKNEKQEKKGSDCCVCRDIGGNSVEKNDKKEDERDDARDDESDDARDDESDDVRDDESTSDGERDDEGNDEGDNKGNDEGDDEKDDDEILSDESCGSWEYEYVNDERVDPSICEQ